MQSKEIIGKRVKDIITGKSGIVTAVIHWMTGCDSVCFEDVDGKSYAGEVSRFEVIDDGVSDRVDEAVLEEEETFIRSMGRRGKDRLTGFEGIAVGVCVNAFRAAQYCVQAPAKEGKLQDSIFMDCSRLFFQEGEPEVPPKTIQGRQTGGADMRLTTGCRFI